MPKIVGKGWADKQQKQISIEREKEEDGAEQIWAGLLRRLSYLKLAQYEDVNYGGGKKFHLVMRHAGLTRNNNSLQFAFFFDWLKCCFALFT